MTRPKLKFFKFDLKLSANINCTGHESEMIDKLHQMEREYGRGYVVELLRQISTSAIRAHLGHGGYHVLAVPSAPAKNADSDHGKVHIKTAEEANEDDTNEGTAADTMRLGGLTEMMN